MRALWRKINKLTSLIDIYIILYRLMLDWIYVTLIVPKHGLTFVDNRTTDQCLLSWVILAVVYILVRKHFIVKSNKGSGIIITILYMVSFVPFTTCIYTGMATIGFIIYNVIYWVVLILVLKLIEEAHTSYSLVSIKFKGIGKHFFIDISIISLIIVFYISWRYAHFRLVTNLFNVYDARAEASGYNLPIIMTYLFSWTLLINSLSFGLFLIRKKYLMAIVSFGIQMLAFGIDGRKSAFFMPFLVLVVVIFCKRLSEKSIKQLIIFGVFFLALACCLEYLVNNTAYISDFGIRRVMIVPNQLGEFYYDYFSTRTPDYFKTGFLRHFGLTSSYVASNGKGYTYLIGEVYFNKLEMSCNNGLSSDAIVNLGPPGCIIMPIVIATFLHLFDKATTYVRNEITVVAAIYISFNIISTTMTTCLLTHGFIVLLIVLTILGQVKKRKNENQELITEIC